MPGIHSERVGRVAVVTLANRAKRNAMTASMASTLLDTLRDLDRDGGTRAVVVTGEGPDAFCSGHDLEEVLEHPETASDPAANEALTMPAQMDTPVIAAVNGAAYAGGFILAMNADLRLVGDNARFGAVGAKIGLVPVGGQLSRLLSALPYPVAFEMLTTTRPLAAADAVRHGFAVEQCPPSATVERAVALGEVIAQQSPAVVRAIKRGLNRTLADGMVAGQRYEPELAADVRARGDGDEGVRAFLERRPAEFADLPGDAMPWSNTTAATAD